MGATDHIISSVVGDTVEVVVVVETLAGSGGGVVLDPDSQVRSSGVRERTEAPSSFLGPAQMTCVFQRTQQKNC